MKKILIILALFSGAQFISEINASPAAVCAAPAASTYNVPAYVNPTAGVKIKKMLTVTWDGNECWVVAAGGRSITPVQARYSDRYRGYPYTVTIGNQTWYFAL